MGIDFKPLVVLFSNGINENVVSNFFTDIARYNVNDIEEYKTSEKLFSRIANAKTHVICICAAEVCYTVMKDILSEGSYPKNLSALMLFCGPHEEFYAMWANRYPVIKFLSHNLKEVRRAVVWCLCGGDFNLQGDAIQSQRNGSVSSMINQPNWKTHSLRDNSKVHKWSTEQKCYETLLPASLSSSLLSSNVLQPIRCENTDENRSSVPAEATANLTRLVTLWLFVRFSVC